MRFHEAVSTLFDLRRFGSRAGTDATAALLDHLGNPQDDLTCIQIAGTNGKGSTARMLESILAEAGLSVGLYTSPHLDDIRERIRVDRRQIREGALTAFVESIEPYITAQAVDGTPPTFFETLTALALYEFDRQAVDVAILEVGIGGRHDATSVIDPIASAVTTVGLDHTSVLGEDVETIARDKAAVTAESNPLVTAAADPALAAIREVAGAVQTVGLSSAGTSSEPDDASDVTVTYRGRDGLEGTATITTPERNLDTNLAMLGAHQARNAGVAVALAEQAGAKLQLSIDTADISTGLRRAHWPGRFELFGQEPLVVLDGAHNPPGAVSVRQTLEAFDFDTLHLIFGALTDKNHADIAAALPRADRVTVSAPDHDRAEDTAVLASVLDEGMDAAVTVCSAVDEAVTGALEDADSDDCILVTGSLYTVAEARAALTRRPVPIRTDSPATARSRLAGAHVPDATIDRMADTAVHRTLRLRLRPGRADLLSAEMRAVGGDCGLSGVEDGGNEPREVVLTGTLSQFRTLSGRLESAGASALAEKLRTHFDDAGAPGTSEALATGTTSDETPGNSSSGSTGAHRINAPWQEGTAVMGILNVTPDSFHDGGAFESEQAAVSRAEAMVDAGADIVDVGGESTRPGADPVSVENEKHRVVPVIERVADLEAQISIDTRKAPVARAALDAGADILNDVSGLADPEMRLVAAEYDVPVVVMHSLETPVDPDRSVGYDDVARDVLESLRERVLLAERAGLDRSQIIVDPGLGFGKSPSESFELLSRLDEFQSLGCPVLVGHSHKSMFGHVDRDPEERYEATVAATALAAERGADIVRVHDVDGNVAAVDVVQAVADAQVD